MNNLSHTTVDVLDRAEYEILNNSLSDEALEAAAGTGSRVVALFSGTACQTTVTLPITSLHHCH